MTANAPAAPAQLASLMLSLREIIDALDRRTPHLERAGEMRIARDALALRREAVERLDELQRAQDEKRDADPVEATGPHDGGA